MNRKVSDQYLKIVEWSDEDNCYIGIAPGLFDGGVHGENEAEVFAELCQAVEDAIRIMEEEGMPLPQPTAGKTYSGNISLRISPGLHKAVAVRALQDGESVNKFIQRELEEAVK